MGRGKGSEAWDGSCGRFKDSRMSSPVDGLDGAPAPKEHERQGLQEHAR